MNINEKSSVGEGAKVIMVVDDEPDIGIIYSMLFEYRGFRVITANNGREALDIATTSKPDIIISDFMMPLMDGGELCLKIKNDPALAKIPFILTSAAFQLRDIAAPYDSLLQKPISFDVLLKEVLRLLGND